MKGEYGSCVEAFLTPKSGFSIPPGGAKKAVNGGIEMRQVASSPTQLRTYRPAIVVFLQADKPLTLGEEHKGSRLGGPSNLEGLLKSSEGAHRPMYILTQPPTHRPAIMVF